MKVYKNLSWLIISPQTLFRAWEIFKRDKRNKLDVAEFGVDIEQHIFGLYRDLKSGTYKHGAYKGFWIHDPKVRRIHKATVRDRVLHHAIFRVLNPIFEPTFIPTSFSCRLGKGTHKGVRWVAQAIRAVSRNNTRPCFALKCDIRKFFDSIDHDTLLGILGARIKDGECIKLLQEIIGSFCSTTYERERESRKGVPIGNLTSQIFANIYMNEFDQFVKHEMKVKYYARYTDDFVIISGDRAYLKGLLPRIKACLDERLKLQLHPKKVEIRSLRRGIDFLGYITLPYHVQLRTKTKRRIPKKIREVVYRYRCGEINKQTLESTLNSYMGVLNHASAYHVRQNIYNQYWFWRTE